MPSNTHSGDCKVFCIFFEPHCQWKEGRKFSELMVQEQPSQAAEGDDCSDPVEHYVGWLGLSGWSRTCLYLLVLLLLAFLVVNFALTVWILRVTCLNTEGMGQLRITTERISLKGVSEFLFPLYVQEIHSRQDTLLLFKSDSQNVSLQACDERGTQLGSLTLGPHSVECVGKNFEVMSRTMASLLSADGDEMIIGAEKLTITGSGGAECESSIETNLVRAVGTKELRLEAPTRSLYMDAPKGISMQALSGSIQALSNMDISLVSMDGMVILDAESMRLPRLPVSKGEGKAVPQEQLYEVCVCADGKLFLSKAGLTSTCHNYSLEC